MTLLTNDQIKNFPVNHISVSAIRQYLTCRQWFFKRYVRLEFDSKKGAALLEWNLFHAVLELYWQDHKDWKQLDFDVENAMQSRIQQFEIDGVFDQIDFWKDWSKEKSIETVRKALEFYFAELPEYTTDQIYSIEEKFLSDFEDLEGNPMPIPLKWFLDLIVKDGDQFDIEDHKLVTKITQQDEVAPAYEIQAAEYWFLVRKTLWINPRRMIFRQTKKTKNTVDLTIEELQAIFDQQGLEFKEIWEKTQLVEFCKDNWIAMVKMPAVTKNVADLTASDIKDLLTSKEIEFKKSWKKEELVAVCLENWISSVDFPEYAIEVEKLTVKDIKDLLERSELKPNIISKKNQMVDFAVESWILQLPPQVVPYVVEYNADILERFLELYRRIVKELSGQPLIDEDTWIVQFLPNPYDQMNGQESWLDFADEVNSGKVWNLNEIKASKPNKFEEYVEALDL